MKPRPLNSNVTHVQFYSNESLIPNPMPRSRYSEFLPKIYVEILYFCLSDFSQAFPNFISFHLTSKRLLMDYYPNINTHLLSNSVEEVIPNLPPPLQGCA